MGYQEYQAPDPAKAELALESVVATKNVRRALCKAIQSLISLKICLSNRKTPKEALKEAWSIGPSIAVNSLLNCSLLETKVSVYDQSLGTSSSREKIDRLA